MALIQAHNICKTYTVGKQSLEVIRHITLDVEEGSFLVVQGSSGSGKTTLLSILSGIDRPDCGRVSFAGSDITNYREDQLAPLRNREMGFVFQSFHLVPSLTALENISFPAELAGDAFARSKAERLMEEFGMTHRSNNLPGQLSGGEQQRIALCRALINEPRVIFADEPTGNLDSHNGDIVIDHLVSINRKLKTALVVVTHNPDIAAQAERVVTLHDGIMTGDTA